MNVALKEASKWFKINKLLLNNTKTKLIVFKNIHGISNDLLVDPPRILNENECISSTTNSTFLGVNIDCNVTWKGHIDLVCTRLTKECYALRILRRQFHTKLMYKIYLGLFEPLIRYGIIFWGAVTYAQNVFIVQKSALRIIFKQGRRHSCRDLFKVFGVMTVPGLYIYEILVNIKKKEHELNKHCDTHSHNTRCKNNFNSRQHSTKLYEQDATFMGMTLFNSLPNAIKNIDQLDSFKTKIKQMIVRIAPYSIKEFVLACKPK
jgi:hypothetical protein